VFRGEIYDPKDRKLGHHIVEQHHNMHIAGHTGCFKTLKLVLRNYWWPQMSRYIGLYQNLQHLQLEEAATPLTLQRASPLGDSNILMGHH
jgi:hypothetical protein